MPRAGQVFVVLDWEGEALAVIQNRSVEGRPFEEVLIDLAMKQARL